MGKQPAIELIEEQKKFNPMEEALHSKGSPLLSEASWGCNSNKALVLSQRS